MKKWPLLLSLSLISPVIFAKHQLPRNNDCDITRFDSRCYLPAYPTKSKSKNRLVYCGDTYVYLSKHDQRRLNFYLKHNKNMVLKLKRNGQYINSPCF